MKQYKAYIFDFDGVIKESVRVKSDAFVQLYEAEGADFQKRVESYHLTNGGVSRYEKFKVWNEWLNRSTSETAIEELAQKFSDLVVENVVASPFIQGAELAIEMAHKSALTFIATGTPDQEILPILDRLNLNSSFTEIHGSSRKKPVITEDILTRFNLDPSEVLFIGDAQTDYHAALECEVDFYLRETDYNAAWFDGKPGITYKQGDLIYLTEIISK